MAVLGVYGVLVEPQKMAIERVEVRLPRLPRALDGLTIAQLSDIHFGAFLREEHLQRIVDVTNTLRADLIVLTGDFVTMPAGHQRRKRLRATEEARPCARVLAGLHSRLGVFAVLGNHDHGDNPNIVTRHFEASSIPVLRNRSTPIEANGARLWLAGVDDVLEKAANLRRTLQDVPKDEPTVLLVHEPDFADQIAAAPYPVDLQLSGHSHGGQVRLPLLGAPVLPILAQKYPWGLRRVGNLQLYTNRGVGTILVPVRLNCPPEITLLTLKSGA